MDHAAKPVKLRRNLKTVRPWRAKHHPENVLFFFRGRKPERRQELFGRVTETVLVGKKVLGPVGNHLCFSRLS
jgi:hypothetical protein